MPPCRPVHDQATQPAMGVYQQQLCFQAATPAAGECGPTASQMYRSDCTAVAATDRRSSKSPARTCLSADCAISNHTPAQALLFCALNAPQLSLQPFPVCGVAKAVSKLLPELCVRHLLGPAPAHQPPLQSCISRPHCHPTHVHMIRNRVPCCGSTHLPALHDQCRLHAPQPARRGLTQGQVLHSAPSAVPVAVES